MENKKHHFVIFNQHPLYKSYFLYVTEFDGTDQDLIDFMNKQKKPETHKIIKGNFVELEFEKEKIFKKHSQGSVFNEKNSESSV